MWSCSWLVQIFALRRKGIASEVVNWLESAARAAGSEQILVECRRANSPARCLYLEHGYHEKIIEAHVQTAGRWNPP